MRRLLLSLLVLALLATGLLYAMGAGWLGNDLIAGTPRAPRIPAARIAVSRGATAKAAAAIGAPEDKQVLFGDLHVHTTFSLDAFMMALPELGGDGAHPVADACDFARYCSQLDFWSVNDHDLSLTPRMWRETIDTMRECNAIAGDPKDPDVVGYLGWEWTQMGTRAENHYGHKNIVLRDLEEDRIPPRPIVAQAPLDARDRQVESAKPSNFMLGLLPVASADPAWLDFIRYLHEVSEVPDCPDNVNTNDLPADCRENAATPEVLFRKLNDWGGASTVIPHGTTWGYYTPLGSSWEKQLNRQQHDPERQRMVEIFSGHGNSEEFRPWHEVIFDPDGTARCPEPAHGYLPSCWRAGEIIYDRCRETDASEDDCQQRAAEARQNYVDADISGHLTVPGEAPEDWLDSGQCKDCFQPAFNYRPSSSVQYMLARTDLSKPEEPLRFRFGFMSSSDNHSARPGTGYKEVARTDETEARFGLFNTTHLGGPPVSKPEPRSQPFDAVNSDLPFFALRETERGASFFLTGGLIGVHSAGRSRGEVWDAMQRREVFGTSGPRILLWFDHVDPATGQRAPMGAEVKSSAAPRFEVRAVGSLEQVAGCAEESVTALGAAGIERLCRDECFNPGDRRRRISRIEVVRIRPQITADEDVAGLIDDPWRVFKCGPDPAGCQISFEDPEFPVSKREALYYVRAIEEPSAAINAANLRCERDFEGKCIRTRPCSEVADDNCLAPTEERAWSSPIFVTPPAVAPVP